MTTTSDHDASDVAQEARPEIHTLITGVDAAIVDIKRSLGDVQGQLKELKKSANELKREVQRRKSKKERKSEREAKEGEKSDKLTGFAAPSVLSKELKQFMGLGAHEMRSRTEVTKWICQYGKDKQLQNEKDRRLIEFTGENGEKLKTLLIPHDHPERENITGLLFHQVQSFLKHHISSKKARISYADSVWDDGSVTAEEYQRLVKEKTEEEAASDRAEAEKLRQKEEREKKKGEPKKKAVPKGAPKRPAVTA